MISLGLLVALPIGLHPTGLQGLRLPSFKTKEMAWSWRWRHGLMAGGAYPSEARSWNNNLRVQQQTVGRTWQQATLCSSGEREGLGYSRN